LTAVRQTFENILTPPNTFTIGAASFSGPIRDGKGHSEVHAAVNNGLVPGTLRVMQAWLSAGPYVQVASVATSLDPIAAIQKADIVVPVVRRFVFILFSPTSPPGLDAAFQLGSYFQPRSSPDGFPAAAGGGGGGGGTGTVVTTAADTAVGIAATVALPVAPLGTKRMTVQNTGGAGTMIRVREVGGPAGSGVLLPSLGFAVYGGVDGAVAALEVEEVAGIATTVAVQFEG
jgi:hypothetical protein